MSDISQVCDAVPCRQLTTKDPRHDADSGSGGGVLAWCRSAVMQAALATALIARSAGRPVPARIDYAAVVLSLADLSPSRLRSAPLYTSTNGARSNVCMRCLPSCLAPFACIRLYSPSFAYTSQSINHKILTCRFL